MLDGTFFIIDSNDNNLVSDILNVQKELSLLIFY